jgi:hypothetical protein
MANHETFLLDMLVSPADRLHAVAPVFFLLLLLCFLLLRCCCCCPAWCFVFLRALSVFLLSEGGRDTERLHAIPSLSRLLYRLLSRLHWLWLTDERPSPGFVADGGSRASERIAIV